MQAKSTIAIWFQFAIASLIIILSTILFLVDGGGTVKPASVFGLYGTVLGYVLGVGTEALQDRRADRIEKAINHKNDQ